MSLTALPYPGSKSMGAGQGAGADILKLLPTDAQHYCEPFAGMLGILLNRPPAALETVNDLNGDIVNWWRVVRDKPHELAEVCLFTPNARAELAACEVDDPNDSDVERARKFTVKCVQALMTTKDGSYRWRRCVTSRSSTNWHTLHNKMLDGRIIAIAQRMAMVQIECRDALEIVDRFKVEPSVLLYVDPPYKVVGDLLYNCQVDHDALTDLLLQANCRIALSGYPGEYPALEADGWHRVDFACAMSMAAVSSGSHQADRTRTECLWLNYDPPGQLGLPL